MALFISSTSSVDKESLQQYVLSQLTKLKGRVDVVIEGDEYKQYWGEVESLVAGNLKARGAVQQVKRLSEYIKIWIKTSVDSNKRFEFFILTKAQEIDSGDQKKDYYWAMQIRHDQMVALVRVITNVVSQIEVLVDRPSKELIKDPLIKGIIEHSIEDQVYLEAEKVHSEREKLSN